MKAQDNSLMHKRQLSSQYGRQGIFCQIQRCHYHVLIFGLCLLALGLGGCATTPSQAIPDPPTSLRVACERGWVKQDWESCNNYAYQIQKIIPQGSGKLL